MIKLFRSIDRRPHFDCNLKSFDLVKKINGGCCVAFVHYPKQTPILIHIQIVGGMGYRHDRQRHYYCQNNLLHSYPPQDHAERIFNAGHAKSSLHVVSSLSTFQFIVCTSLPPRSWITSHSIRSPSCRSWVDITTVVP